jgi:predicted amidohydrolase
MSDLLHICLVQSALAWEDKDANYAHFQQQLSLVKKGTDLVLLPETFTTGFSMKKEVAEKGNETLEWMKKMAAAHGLALAGSLFVEENEQLYNRLYLVQADGTVHFYNKKHLFRLTNEQEIFTAGNTQVVMNLKGWKISFMVCYDLRFPVWMRRSPVHDYDLLLVVANWPERRSLAWNSLLVARAIENQTYVAAVNRVGNDGNGFLYAGDSVVLDPMGKSLAKGKPFVSQLVYATLDAAKLQATRQALPFYEDRDGFTL